MSDLRKLLDIVAESSAGATGAGSVASVSQPMTTQRRVQEQTPAAPDVMEYGNWENSALTTSSKLKKSRSRAAKVVKSIYGEDHPDKKITESSRKKPVLEATGDTGFDSMMSKISATAPQATRSNDAANRIVMNARRLVNSAEFLRIAEQHADKLQGSGGKSIGEITLHTLAALADLVKTNNSAIQESQLEEQDLIVNPAAISRKISGLMGKQQDRTDHEVQMAKSDLFQACKNAAAIFDIIKDRSEQEGIEGWVQKKITTAEDYLSTVRDYLEGTKLESMDGVSPGTRMFASEQTQSSRDKICPQCGMQGCKCAPGTCKCTPKPGYPKSVAEDKSMSRAAKGNEKYGKDGMKALAKAGREGASEKKLDTIRAKYDHYNESVEENKEQGVAEGSEKAYGWKIGKMYRGEKEPFEVAYVDASDEKTALAKAHHTLKPNHMQILTVMRRPQGVAEATDAPTKVGFNDIVVTKQSDGNYKIVRKGGAWMRLKKGEILTSQDVKELKANRAVFHVEQGVAEDYESKKTFVVVYYSPKTDRNVTTKVQANNESEVWDKLKSKNIEVISVKLHSAD